MSVDYILRTCSWSEVETKYVKQCLFEEEISGTIIFMVWIPLITLQAAIKCNGRKAVTNFEPSAYEGETKSNNQSEGSQQDLDLNLGITTSSLNEIERYMYDVNAPGAASQLRLACSDI